MLQLNTSPFEPTFGTYNIVPTTSASTLEAIQNYKGIEPYVDQGNTKLNNVTGSTQIVSSQNGIITLTPSEQKALQQAQNSSQLPNGSTSTPATNQSPSDSTTGNPQSGTGNNNNITKINNSSNNQVITDNKNGTPKVIDQSQTSIENAKKEKAAAAAKKIAQANLNKSLQNAYLNGVLVR